MSARVTARYADDVAWLALDDGKANALSPALQAELNAALDRAEKEARAIVIAGRSGVFSGGFDLSILKGRRPERGGPIERIRASLAEFA